MKTLPQSLRIKSAKKPFRALRLFGEAEWPNFAVGTR